MRCEGDPCGGEPHKKRARTDSGEALCASGGCCAGEGAVDVGMPPSFSSLLGPYQDPDEARDLEDLVSRGKGGSRAGGGGDGDDPYADFGQLSSERQEALLNAVRTLAAQAASASSANQLEHLRVKASRLKGFKDTARKSELTAAYRRLVSTGEVQPSTQMDELLMRKRGRSHSGVLVITSFFGPGEFSCPKDCHYCPNQPGIARSYLLQEPAVLRGFRNGWDPIRQFRDRASALDKTGHVVDKVELILLGGTFSFYPKPYAEGFIAASFYAANTYYDARDETGGSCVSLPARSEPAESREACALRTVSLRPMLSLAEEIAINETARCRIIGVTVETRPDYINSRELRRFRSLGVTRVQLGIQHLDDAILTVINRDCPTAKTVRAIKLLLDAGFKVDAHWMPDLPGSSYEKDREMFETLFSPENESFQVDQWKVYPTATVPFTKISAWYDEGKYKPYAERDGGEWMVKLLLYIMANCPYHIRLNRIVRDIPSTYIKGGERRVNLRQVLEREMRREGIRCKDIRERECKGSVMDPEKTRLFTEEYRASGGTEYYMSVENEDRTQLYGHLRLRLRDDPFDPDANTFPVLSGSALIRELHTYGKLVAVDKQNSGGEAQHVGVGTQLMREAEQLAKKKEFRRVAVIAGVGARRYYAKLGYRLEDTYMIKELVEAASTASGKAAEGEGEGGREGELCGDGTHARGTLLSSIRSFFGLGAKR